MNEKNKKVIIIGCGIAGPSLAIALKRAGIDCIIYESHDAISDFGWLTLTANGTTIWKSFGIFEKIIANSMPIEELVACNFQVNVIGTINTGEDLERKYDAGIIMIARESLTKILYNKAIVQGTVIEFGKKLADIKETGDKVIAYFEDGTSAQGDFLIGCDGIHSRTRSIIIPDAPRPTYAGHVIVGGITDSNDCASSMSPNKIYLTYGKKAFFENILQESGVHMWFTYVNHPEPPKYKRGEKNNNDLISEDQWRKKLSQIHKDDSKLVQESINAPGVILPHFPIYDIPYLPTWHKKSVCLIGDAAHATSPHIGEGASMAMGDAIVLAKCLRDIPNTEKAFETFEKLRKNRTERVVKMAQQYGDAFTTTNPIKKWIRNRMIPKMIKRGNKPLDWIYSYKIDWDEKIK